MNTCVRCGTQFAAGEDRCPFCSLPVAGDADVTRAAQDPSVWQQPGQLPGQQPGQQSGPQAGQQWGGQQPSGEGPWQQSGPQQSGQPGPSWQGGPPAGGWQGQQPGPWQSQPGPQGGGWQQGPPPGGQPWQAQGGGMPPKKGMNPGVLIGAGLATLLVLGLVIWGLVAAFGGDDDDSNTASGTESSSSEPSPTESSSEASPTEESTPTEESSPTEGPTEDPGGGGGGSDVVDFDLSSGPAVVTVTVSSPGRLRIEAQSDVETDIVMVVNDPDGNEVCNEDSLITFPEECTIQAEVGEYEVVVTPYDEDARNPGTGEVRIS
ncbi:hypothetical protein [Nocardioides sp. CFH 31398]|uniref:hypothetical protein n=1 Tax=Nocardioides sp. CFH 31398 TaxID=2919579 RepID=UPI001F06DBDC|nr:hypothetical protein [Nocardioides sp. CFH 31398]MCH1868931.1 hypothetical protein [Nocardioides sp. CFH 31398]